MQGQQFIDGLRAALVKTGLTENEARKYVFHGWRHFYTSYLMGKLEKKLLKSQTGHLTDAINFPRFHQVSPNFVNLFYTVKRKNHRNIFKHGKAPENAIEANGEAIHN